MVGLRRGLCSARAGVHRGSESRLLSATLLSALLAVPSSSSFASKRIGVAYRGWRVQSIEILGVEKSVARELTDGLALAKREGRLLGRFRRPSYQPELLQEDVQRVRLYFATRGYPRAQVEPRLRADEARRRLTVELQVHLGAQVHVGEILVPGLPARLSAGPDVLGISAGEPFEDAKLVTAHARLLQLLLDHGYAAADVKREIDFIDSTRVLVRMNVTPGEIHYVKDVTFEGASEDLRKLARKTIGVQQGALSTPKSLSDGSKRLQRLRLFRRVEFETPSVEPGKIALKCRLTASEPRTVEAGIGAWSDGIIQGRASWAHRNLFKGGRGLGLRALVSEVEQELALAVWQPSILGPKTRATGIVRGRLQNEDTYRSAAIEVETNLTFSFSVDRDHELETGVVFAHADYTGNVEGMEQPAGRFVTGKVRWLNDASDHPFYPRHGFMTHAGVESTIPGLGSQTDFVWTQVTAVYYQPLPRRSVLAFRLTPGYVLEYGGEGPIPPDRLFYAGGALSMRGFKRRELGPRDSNGTPTGGRLLLELSSEVRMPAWWRLGFAAFVDAAQVWAQPSDAQLGRMEVAAGPGVAFDTPVGPIRGDVGFRLTDFDTTQPKWVFHFYIGKPY